MTDETPETVQTETVQPEPAQAEPVPETDTPAEMPVETPAEPCFAPVQETHKRHAKRRVSKKAKKTRR